MAEAALVPTGGDLLVLDDVVGRLATLVDADDAPALGAVAAAAQARELWERRQGAGTQAAYFARIKVLAEAGIGTLDRKARSGRKEPWNLDLPDPGPKAAEEWRTLAVAHERRMLLSTCDRLERDEFSISSRTAVASLRRQGVLWVPTTALERRVRRLKEQGDERPLSDFDREAGVARDTLSRIIQTKQPRVKWDVGARLATALGVEPARLPAGPQPAVVRKVRATRDRMARRALNEATRSRAARRMAGKAGTDEAEAYAMAERFSEVLGRARANSVSPHAREHWQRAEEMYHAMRDEIWRALGVS